MRIKTLTRSLAVSTGLALVLMAQPASAQLVSGSDLVSAQDSAGNPGQLTISNPNASTANISVLSPVVVSNWIRFNVPDATTLNISNDSGAAQASLLARVVGTNGSNIGGTISASDTNLWLVNQNGIFFGNNAAVSASSLFASTLDTSDVDFFDFYEGTNNALNGTGTVRFLTNPAATTFISSFGGRFKTDGALMFVSPALNLAGDFNAGSGSAAFVAASDVSVTFNAGSPLGYGLNAGTSVASQLVRGSIAGNRADFVHFAQAAVTNALLTVDASVATTATASSTGISLRTASSGSNGVGVAVTGPLQSSGQIASSISGNASFSADMTGSLVALNVGGALSAKDIAATAGTTTLNAQNIDALAVSGRDGVSFQASNTGHANFASLNSANGPITVSGNVPGTTTVAGAVSGRSVTLIAINALQVGGAVTATAGEVSLLSTAGSVNAQSVTASGGNVQLRAGTQVSGGAITSTGGIAVDAPGSVQLASIAANSDGIGAEGATIGTTVMPSSITVTGATSGGSVRLITSGNMQLGNVTSTGGTVDLDSTNGAISAGAVSATGGNTMLTAPGAITTTSVASTAAIDVDSTGSGNLNLGNLNAGTTINLDTGGTARFGSATAGGAFAIGASVDPSSITATGNISAGSIDFDSTGLLDAQGITATAGGIDIDTGAVKAGALAATAAITIDAAGSIALTSANADSDSNGSGVLVIGGNAIPSSLTITGPAKGVNAILRASGPVSLGNVTSTGGVVDIDSTASTINAGAVSATGGDALLTARGGVTTSSIASTTGAIDVASTNGGNLNLGNLSAGTTVAVDTNLGSIAGGSVTAGGRVEIGNGGASGASTVTLTGNVVGSNVNIYSRQNMSVKDVTATAGSAFLNTREAGSTVSAGNVGATDFAGVGGRGNVTAASITGDLDNDGFGYAVAQSDNSDVTISGDMRGEVVNVYAGGNASVANVTATVGNAIVRSISGNGTAGDITAKQYAAVYGSGSFTTGALTGGYGVVVSSDGGGAVNVGNIASDGVAEFNTSGSLTLGAVTKATALRIGQSGLIGNSAMPNAINITGNVSAGSIDIDGTGAFTAKDMTATTGALSIDAGSISANNLRSAGNLTFSTANTGDATFDSLVSTGGVVAVTGSVPRNLTVNGVVEGRSVGLYAGNQIQVGNVTATSGSADLFTFNGGIVAGNVGATGGDVSLTSARGVTANALSATGGIAASAAGNMALGNLSAGTGIALDAAGALSFGDVTAPTAPLTIGASNQPSSINSAGVINVASLAARTTGALSLSGANRIGQINNVSAGGSLLINNAIDTTVAGTVTSASDVTLKSGGDLTVASTGGVTGGLVALSAFGNFINDSGSDAVTASDHWVVYSNAPVGNVFGGLDSGNTALWNATLATRAPGTISGNRYVFAYQPTLTVASTDASKVYGTDLTGLLNGYYTASGLQPGVAGAYQADTLASILSGTPTITSAGAVANADVAGSPYAMNIAQGSLGVSNGYALVLTSTGKLTVTPKPISASVGANDKTYDGTTGATGTVTLTGTLAGDDIGTGGTVFTFSDKNVGTDKTVTVSGTMLTGADAGNYTLTVPATTLADIFAKAINASVAANSKTYDGTTTASGSVTLNGVVAGDSVGTSGTTFTFSDKNAGTGKTVTITGTVLTGADAGNYTLDIPATTLADILARAISAAVAANSKTYDGTTAATGSVTLSGVIAGDSVGTAGTSFTFNDKNVGKNKTVSVSGTTLTGADAGNYTLTLPATTLADIFAKAITATVAANNKTYDGTTAATGTVTLNGVIAGDSVGTSGTVFTFSDKNAGTNKTVSVTGTALTGADAGNYTVTFPTSTLASILQRALQLTADDQVKFRNDPDPALTYSVGGQGLVAGDTLSGSLTRQPGEALGDYAIDQGSLSASANYTVSYAPGTLSIVRDPVADAAAAGQNALRALPLPSDTAAQRGAILVVDADGLCPPEDKDCRVR